MADGHAARIRRLTALVAGLALLAAFPLLLAGRTDEGAFLLFAAVVVGVVGRGRTRSKAEEERAAKFDEWLHQRGLVVDPAPVADRAATAEVGDARVTVMDWSYVTTSSDGSGRTVRLTALVVAARPTGSHLLLQPARWKQLPAALRGTRRWTSGDATFDKAFTVLTTDAHDPTWLDAGVCAALAAAAGREVEAEVHDDVIVISQPRVDPERWNDLLRKGREIAQAVTIEAS